MRGAGGSVSSKKVVEATSKASELTPERVHGLRIAPDLSGAEHRVHGSGEPARSSDACNAPSEAFLLLLIEEREPTVGGRMVMPQDGLDEGAPEPAVGTGGNGSVTDGLPRTRRPRRQTCIADQVLRASEPGDGLHLGRDEERPERTDARDGLEQLDGGDPTADTPDLFVQALDHHGELIDEPLVGVNEEPLLRPESRPGFVVDPIASHAGE